MTSRRVLLTSAGAVVLAGCAGCAVYGAEQPPAAAPAPAGPPQALAQVADIPVGGGKIFAAQKVGVTQPQAGVIKACSAICTHQGCTVENVTGGTINCPCHGSAFHAADGTVANGPATRPLPPAPVTVVDGQIRLG